MTILAFLPPSSILFFPILSSLYFSSYFLGIRPFLIRGLKPTISRDLSKLIWIQHEIRPMVTNRFYLALNDHFFPCFFLLGFIAFSAMPELSHKIKMFFALAPVIYVKHVPNLLLRFLASLPQHSFKVLIHWSFFYDWWNWKRKDDKKNLRHSQIAVAMVPTATYQ